MNNKNDSNVEKRWRYPLNVWLPSTTEMFKAVDVVELMKEYCLEGVTRKWTNRNIAKSRNMKKNSTLGISLRSGPISLP